MKKFHIVLNSDKIKSSDIAQYAASYLIEHGADVKTTTGYIKKGNISHDTDCIITLGGDGTIIRAAGDVAGRNIPLLGINVGHLGYLTSSGDDRDSIKDILDKLLNDQYNISKRMMIESIVKTGDGHEEGPKLVLNEVVAMRGRGVKAIKLTVYVDDVFLNEYSADGIIIATPTGSTAYNLSAGGPVAEPEAQMMILTPICPHALNQRSIVFPASSKIDIEISDDDNTDQVVVFDGNEGPILSAGSCISVKRSMIETYLIKPSAGTFLDNLRNKMNGV